MDYPADIRSLLRHLGTRKFAVQGGSGGAPYALACAHSMPDRLLGIRVFAGAGPWAAGRQYVSTLRKIVSFAAAHSPSILKAVLDTYIINARWALNTKIGTRYIDRWLESQESPERAGLSTEKRREMLMQMIFEAFAQGGGAMVEEAVLLTHDWGFRLEDITYNKVRLWYGEEDTHSLIEMIQYMVERIPHCELTAYEGEINHFAVGAHAEGIIAELVPDSLIRRHMAAIFVSKALLSLNDLY
ncbi:alpha/beta fold hydrolase [Aspergillus undulatus]|uniref:alpha/beta fold hydrolase n=1 Tax=Aspergillus undulatus TaxID=1810928 RepID=UPI003CCCD8C2